MRACVVLNPHAGSSGGVRELVDRIGADRSLELLVSERSGHARELVRKAAEAGFSRIISAGGDGTTNEAVNGLDGHFDRVTLGILPLGTGNDLPRTLALPDDPVEALELALTGPGRAIDLVRVEMERTHAWCVNVAAGGFSGELNEILTDEVKRAWGPLAYLRGALSALPDLTRYRTRVRFDEGDEERFALLNLIIANGRRAAGGFAVAPRANPEDGLLDVIGVQIGSTLDVAGVAARLVGGDYTQADVVWSRRARSVRVRAEPGMWFNIDGELIGNDPVVFRVAPRRLRVVTGPMYSSDVSLK